MSDVPPENWKLNPCRRSWRYAAVVVSIALELRNASVIFSRNSYPRMQPKLILQNDGEIEWIAVENPTVENSGPDPYEVSGAEHVMAYLSKK